ncbi:MAG: hypothetical protein QOH21_663 [Acidobacteriota bacterium]|jgi:hypothetical protein|nr:hypothetical protein [Acidobacteriota bacterium]
MEITHLLADRDRGAREQLTPLVYAELRRIAARQIQREEEGHTLQPTALVNEPFVRLCGGASASWQDRAHFYGVCAQVMLRISPITRARSCVTNGRTARNGFPEYKGLAAKDLSATPIGGVLVPTGRIGG